MHLELGCVHLALGCMHLALGCMHLALGCMQHVKNLDSVTLYLYIFVTWHFVTFKIFTFNIFSFFSFLSFNVMYMYLWNWLPFSQFLKYVLKLFFQLVKLVPAEKIVVRRKSISEICIENWILVLNQWGLSYYSQLICHCAIILTINHTVDYMVHGFMIFMRGIDITRGIGRVLLNVEPVLGPEIARA